MWFRSASRGPVLPPRSSVARRLVVVAGLAAVASAPLAGTAVAAPIDVTVSLGPSAPQVATVTEPVAGTQQGKDAVVGYGGSMTVQFSPLAAPGPDAVFTLVFFEPTGPHIEGMQFSTDTSDSTNRPLGVTDLGGHAYRIDVPEASQVPESEGTLSAELEVQGITSSLPYDHRGWPREGNNVNLNVTHEGPAAVAVVMHPLFNNDLPTVAAAVGGTIRLRLPTSSTPYRAGSTSLRDAQITFQTANAHSLIHGWGPALPISTAVSADGLVGSVRLPAGVATGTYALQVLVHQPHLAVMASFLVNLAAADPAPVTSTAASPTTTATASEAPPAVGTPEAAGTGAPRLRSAAAAGPSWIAWTGIGVAVLAVVGGAAFLIRRRVISR